jgi:hypothetical protein
MMMITITMITTTQTTTDGQESARDRARNKKQMRFLKILKKACPEKKKNQPRNLGFS